MKQLFTLILFSVVLYSCKKELSGTKPVSYLESVKFGLKDSLGKDDYSQLEGIA